MVEDLEFKQSEGTLSFEEFSQMGYEEKLDYITVWMEDTIKRITNLALKIKSQVEERAEFENKVKTIAKSLDAESNQRNIVHDILYDRVNYGNLKEYTKSEKFRKEKSPLWRWVI